jgi:hypothetical protein
MLNDPAEFVRRSTLETVNGFPLSPGWLTWLTWLTSTFDG